MKNNNFNRSRERPVEYVRDSNPQQVIQPRNGLSLVVSTEHETKATTGPQNLLGTRGKTQSNRPPKKGSYTKRTRESQSTFSLKDNTFLPVIDLRTRPLPPVSPPTTAPHTPPSRSELSEEDAFTFSDVIDMKDEDLPPTPKITRTPPIEPVGVPPGLTPPPDPPTTSSPVMYQRGALPRITIHVPDDEHELCEQFSRKHIDLATSTGSTNHPWSKAFKKAAIRDCLSYFENVPTDRKITVLDMYPGSGYNICSEQVLWDYAGQEYPGDIRRRHGLNAPLDLPFYDVVFLIDVYMVRPEEIATYFRKTDVVMVIARFHSGPHYADVEQVGVSNDGLWTCCESVYQSGVQLPAQWGPHPSIESYGRGFTVSGVDYHVEHHRRVGMFHVLLITKGSYDRTPLVVKTPLQIWHPRSRYDEEQHGFRGQLVQKYEQVSKWFGELWYGPQKHFVHMDIATSLAMVYLVKGFSSLGLDVVVNTVAEKFKQDLGMKALALTLPTVYNDYLSGTVQYVLFANKRGVVDRLHFSLDRAKEPETKLAAIRQYKATGSTPGASRPWRWLLVAAGVMVYYGRYEQYRQVTRPMKLLEFDGPYEICCANRRVHNSSVKRLVLPITFLCIAYFIYRYWKTYYNTYYRNIIGFDDPGLAPHFHALWLARSKQEQDPPVIASCVEYPSSNCFLPSTICQLPLNVEIAGRVSIRLMKVPMTLGILDNILPRTLTPDPSHGIYPIITPSAVLHLVARCNRNAMVALVHRQLKPTKKTEYDPKSWEPGFVILTRALEPFFPTHWNIEEDYYSGLQGPKAEGYRRAAKEADATGERAVRKQINVKTDETLFYGKKPRSICALSMFTTPMCASTVTQLTKFAKKALDGKTLYGDILLYFGSGRLIDELNDVFSQPFTSSFLATAGDDVVYYNHHHNTWYEVDATAFDQSQPAAALLGGVAKLLERFQVPPEVLSMFKHECTSTFHFKNKFLTGSGRAEGTQLPTGIMFTTFSNTLVMMAAMLFVHTQGFLNTSDIVTLGAKLNLTLKVKTGKHLADVTFLKGWFVPCHGSHKWAPLPSIVLKIAKVTDRPEVLMKHKNRDLAIRQFSHAFGCAFPGLSADYPVIGACTTSLRVNAHGAATDIQPSESYRNIYEVSDSKNIPRHEVIRMIYQRYRLTEEDVVRLEQLYTSVRRLPAFLVDPAFHILAEIDYG